jgi:two-component system nitrate/nitrite response regulator NarL
MVILFISHVHFLREALVEVLRGGEGIMAFGAFSRETADAVTAEFTPNLVVIDSSHPEAMALVSVVRTRLPKVSVVVLATRERDEDFLLWADIGISGYLGPDTSSRDLISTVRRAAAGEVVCPPRLTALLLNRFADRSSDRATRAGIHALTPREREIMELLADGLPNKLIARRLQVALPTVKNHVHSILDKWDVRSRGEAAARYRRKVQEAESGSNRFTAARPIHVHPAGSPAHRNGSFSSPAGRRAE